MVPGDGEPALVIDDLLQWQSGAASDPDIGAGEADFRVVTEDHAWAGAVEGTSLHPGEHPEDHRGLGGNVTGEGWRLRGEGCGEMLIRAPVLGDDDQVGVDVGREERLLGGLHCVPVGEPEPGHSHPRLARRQRRQLAVHLVADPGDLVGRNRVRGSGDDGDPDLIGSPLPDRGEAAGFRPAGADSSEPDPRPGPSSRHSSVYEPEGPDQTLLHHRAQHRGRGPVPGRPDPRRGRWRPSSQNSGVVCEALTWRATAIRCSSSWIKSVPSEPGVSGSIRPSRALLLGMTGVILVELGHQVSQGGGPLPGLFELDLGYPGFLPVGGAGGDPFLEDRAQLPELPHLRRVSPGCGPAR